MTAEAEQRLDTDTVAAVRYLQLAPYMHPPLPHLYTSRTHDGEGAGLALESSVGFVAALERRITEILTGDIHPARLGMADTGKTED